MVRWTTFPKSTLSSFVEDETITKRMSSFSATQPRILIYQWTRIRITRSRWQLLDPDRAEPHLSGKTLIVGHTEQTDGEVLDLGFIRCIDTACWRYGWLTAMDVHSGEIWQAQRFGVLREAREPAVGPIGDGPIRIG